MSEQNTHIAPEFSQDWFSSVVPTWTDKLSKFIGREQINYLEVGVFEGRSLRWMFETVLTHPSSQATGVDNFQTTPEAKVHENLKSLEVSNRYKLLSGMSSEVLRSLPPGSFDIIYVDGDHRGRGAFLDLALTWDLLKIGGALIFDDCDLFATTHPQQVRPQLPADTFLTCFANEFNVLFRDPRQFIVEKKAEWCPGTHYVEFGNYALDFGSTNKKPEPKLFDKRTGGIVELTDSEAMALADMFIHRPVGQLEPCTKVVSKSLLRSLRQKIDF